MLTFGTEIVIRYIAKECMRLRPIPPHLPVTSYITDRTQGQGYAHLIHKKIVWAYYILCVLWYAYYEDSKSVDIPTIVQL